MSGYASARGDGSERTTGRCAVARSLSLRNNALHNRPNCARMGRPRPASCRDRSCIWCRDSRTLRTPLALESHRRDLIDQSVDVGESSLVSKITRRALAPTCMHHFTRLTYHRAPSTRPLTHSHTSHDTHRHSSAAWGARMRCVRASRPGVRGASENKSPGPVGVHARGAATAS